jgi:hypothetical protein
VDATLGPAGEHGIRMAVPDLLGPLADRVRPGCTGGHDREVRAANTELDRQLPAWRVDQHVRDEHRRDAIGAALAKDVVLLHQLVEAADAGPEDDSGALGLITVDPGVLHGLLGRCQAEEDRTVEVPRALGRRGERRIEVLYLSRDLHREVVRVERSDEVDAAPALDEPLPGRLHVISERRDGTDSGYGHTSHPELDTGAWSLVAPITT